MMKTDLPPAMRASKLQHHVFYVTELARSKEFYTQLLDLQFSATNHPDSSAAMRLTQQEMHFFSFGYYHHDICLVKHHKLTPDNGSMLHFTLIPRDKAAIDAIRARAGEMSVPIREGRLIASAGVQEGQEAFALQDPDNHWIEFLAASKIGEPKP